MKYRRLEKKMERHLMVLIGTDIPPMHLIESMLFGAIEKKLEEKPFGNLRMDEIFEYSTLKKKERFFVLQRLIKKKIIKRIRINEIYHKYIVIPQINFSKAKEVRLYRPKNRREYLAVQRKFRMTS
jgi:hypothetical protein